MLFLCSKAGLKRKNERKTGVGSTLWRNLTEIGILLKFFFLSERKYLNLKVKLFCEDIICYSKLQL